MEKEWWENAIKHLEDMSMKEFAELVEKAEEVKLPFPADNIVLLGDKGKFATKQR